VQEEMGKGVKTTATVPNHALLQIKEKKEGLLGETITTDDIVDPSTNPDPLSISVLSSTVEQYTATKARKRTTTSDGPLLLEEDSMVDSPIGLVKAKVSKSIVGKGTQPSLPISTSDQALKILSETITPIDSVKAERDKVEVSSWPTNTGVDYDEQLGIGVFYTETIVAPNSYKDKNWSEVPNQNIKPLDNWKSIKKEIDKEKASSALLSQWYKIGIDTQVSLPDKLLDIIVYWGRSYGNGGDYDFGAGAFTGSYNRNQSGSSKSSYSMNGDVYFNIQKGFNGTIPGYEHIFFIEIGKDGLVSQGDVIARLNFLESSKGSNIVYKNWPYLQLRSENLVLISGGISLTRSESLSESVSINGFSSSTGSGKSFDVNVNANSVNIPESLHGRVTIKNEFIGSVPPGGMLDVTYGVNPSQLSATEAKLGGVLTEVAQFPTGNYLLSSSIELYKWGFVKVTAKTVTISSDYI
jgi:hypothetical protein